jgi:hypothetical protein
MRLVFLTMRKSCLICGLDPMLSAQTLGMIGNFNVLHLLFFLGRSAGIKLALL